MNINNPIAILDCTLRDGALAGAAVFTPETARALYRAACLAGIEYVELGYRNDRDLVEAAHRNWLQILSEDDIQAITDGGPECASKISIMQDAHKAKADALRPAADSRIDLVRVASYTQDLETAADLINSADAKGYECSINIMAASRETPERLDRALRFICGETDVDIIYLVDSYGALLTGDLAAYFHVYQSCAGTRRIGMHFHNSRQHAFANSIAGMQLGADIIDTTLMGIGRGSGNCPTELFLDYLNHQRYNLDPLLDAAEKHILPLRRNMQWGYHIPYMLAAGGNYHPRDAVAWMKSKNRRPLVDFYRSLKKTDKEPH